MGSEDVAVIHPNTTPVVVRRAGPLSVIDPAAAAIGRVLRIDRVALAQGPHGPALRRAREPVFVREIGPRGDRLVGPAAAEPLLLQLLDALGTPYRLTGPRPGPLAVAQVDGLVDRPVVDAAAVHERLLVRCGAGVDPALVTVDLCRGLPDLRVVVLGKRAREVRRATALLDRAGVDARTVDRAVGHDDRSARVAVCTYQGAGHDAVGLWDVDLLVVLDAADGCGEWARAAVRVAHVDHPAAPRVVGFARAGFGPSANQAADLLRVYGPVVVDVPAHGRVGRAAEYLFAPVVGGPIAGGDDRPGDVGGPTDGPDDRLMSDAGTKVATAPNNSMRVAPENGSSVGSGERVVSPDLVWKVATAPGVVAGSTAESAAAPANMMVVGGGEDATTSHSGKAAGSTGGTATGSSAAWTAPGPAKVTTLGCTGTRRIGRNGKSTIAPNEMTNGISTIGNSMNGSSGWPGSGLLGASRVNGDYRQAGRRTRRPPGSGGPTTPIAAARATLAAHPVLLRRAAALARGLAAGDAAAVARVCPRLAGHRLAGTRAAVLVVAADAAQARRLLGRLRGWVPLGPDLAGGPPPGAWWGWSADKPVPAVCTLVGVRAVDAGAYDVVVRVDGAGGALPAPGGAISVGTFQAAPLLVVDFFAPSDDVSARLAAARREAYAALGWVEVGSRVGPQLTRFLARHATRPGGRRRVERDLNPARRQRA